MSICYTNNNNNQGSRARIKTRVDTRKEISLCWFGVKPSIHVPYWPYHTSSGYSADHKGSYWMSSHQCSYNADKKKKKKRYTFVKNKNHGIKAKILIHNCTGERENVLYIYTYIFKFLPSQIKVLTCRCVILRSIFIAEVSQFSDTYL